MNILAMVTMLPGLLEDVLIHRGWMKLPFAQVFAQSGYELSSIWALGALLINIRTWGLPVCPMIVFFWLSVMSALFRRICFFFKPRLRQESSWSRGPWGSIGASTLPGVELQLNGPTGRPGNLGSPCASAVGNPCRLAVCWSPSTCTMGTPRVFSRTVGSDMNCERTVAGMVQVLVGSLRHDQTDRTQEAAVSSDPCTSCWGWGRGVPSKWWTFDESLVNCSAFMISPPEFARCLQYAPMFQNNSFFHAATLSACKLCAHNKKH